MASGASWSIRVLEYARAPECPASVLVYGALGVRTLPYSITVLQSSEHTVLVDTGYEQKMCRYQPTFDVRVEGDRIHVADEPRAVEDGPAA